MTNVMNRSEGAHGVFGQYQKAAKPPIVFLMISEMMTMVMKMTIRIILMVMMMMRTTMMP